MKGTITTLAVDGSIEVTLLDRPVKLDDLKKAIGGGLIEAVPYFNKYNGEPCVAFVDEEGKLKGFQPNPAAQALWQKICSGAFRDQLVGRLAIVQGDDAFMETL